MINAVVLFLVAAAGSWIAFVGQDRIRSIVLAVAAGPAIGLGCVFLVTFFILFAGIQLNFFSAAFGLILTMTLFAVIRLSAHTTHENGASVDSLLPALRLVVYGAVAVTIGAICIAAYLWIQSAPHGSTDAVAFWTSRGLFLHRVEDDIPLRFSLMKKGHPTYPLLLPAALAGQYTLAGNESLLTPQLLGIVVLAALLLLVWAVTYRFGGSLRAALAVLLIGSTPVLWRWAFMQCADVLLSYLLLLSAASLFSLVMRNSSTLFSPLLTGFFLGMLFSAKTEGQAAALLLIVIATAFAALNGRLVYSARHHAPALLAGMVPGFAATILFKKVWCRNVDVPAFFRSEFSHTITDLGRWKFTANSIFANFTRTESVELWGWIWLLIAAVLLVRFVRLFRGEIPELNLQTFLFFTCTGMILAYASAYVLTPYDLDWQITKSIDRLFLQLLPSIAVAAILAIGPQRRASQSSSTKDKTHRP